MKITKTNLEIINFINFARGYMSQHKEPTKFRYALERMEKRAAKAYETYTEELAAINIDNAATDKEQVILTDAQGNFRFTKEGLKARNKAQKELLEKAVELEAYHATEIPDNLSDEEKQATTGFVMPEIEPAQEEREYNAEPV